ncbi:leucine-rich repeat domain-containing protein [Ruminococcus albus]|uniref:leucine-rich repeat domain-containing protein n=1 Tax=Ruminococcus albus TaxID=1264 RepID=UPI0004632846|nr:leucine-rich repeat domain-containing protein [Ruminococcus albus]
MESKNKQKSIIKIIRNIILSVLALVILIYVIINIVFWKKGMPERYFDYEVLENDTIEIEHYTGPFFLLNIPDTIEGKPVTSIGNSIFEEPLYENGKYVDTKYYVMYKYVTAIHLPDTVEEIHFCAFEDCTSLITINIPSKLKYTGERILTNTKVRKLVFPEGITEIGCGEDIDLEYDQVHESFSEMEYLQEVVFPESLKKIGNNAFSKCPSLKKITLPDSVEEIKYGAFQNSGLTKANIPQDLVTNCGCIFKGTPFEKTLEKEATGDFIIFNDVLLYKYIGDDENVVIPDGIESICSRAFWEAQNIKTVEIPESVKYINGAFQYSSIESLIIPDTVDPDNDMSFYDCYNLESITLPNKIKKIPRSAFENCFSLEKITIPASVEEIGDDAFENCTSLEQVIREGSPKIGENVFKGCTALENKPE